MKKRTFPLVEVKPYMEDNRTLIVEYFPYRELLTSFEKTATFEQYMEALEHIEDELFATIKSIKDKRKEIRRDLYCDEKITINHSTEI